MMLSGGPSLEHLVDRAVAGERDAVAALVRGIQGKVYALALRMLWRREEAEDATQEILVRVVTRLGQFDGRSRVESWVYRVATNYLIDVKRSCVERQGLTFETLANDLVDGITSDGPADNERAILVEEVRIGCTLAMLQCLDRPHRLAYVLGEIFELPAPEAAAALELEPAAFRKRLQRAREAVESFTRAHCGLVSDARCQCNRRVAQAIRLSRVRIDRQDFATGTTSFGEVRRAVQHVEHAKRTLAMYQASRPVSSSVDFVQRVVSALDLDLAADLRVRRDQPREMSAERTTTTNPGSDGTGC